MSKKYRKEISVVVEWEEGDLDGFVRGLGSILCPIDKCYSRNCKIDDRCPDCWAEFMKDAQEVEG